LLSAAKRNAARGLRDLDLFETGLQFHDITPDGQRMVSAGIRTGNRFAQEYKNDGFQHAERAVDAFDAKGDALAVLEALGMAASAMSVTANTPAWYHPGRSGALTLGGKIILGYFGELHPAILAQFDIEHAVAGFEIFLQAVPAPRSKGKARPSLKPSDFQAVQRDFAFMVDRSVSAAEMIKALAQADKQLITDVRIFDVYTGVGVEPGKKSVAINVTLQASDRTLSEQDISAVSSAIIAAAQKGFGGQLRQ
jgi:phenylalanyl-tRNA synthetase beta chain